jgi:seryl-tRNA synthetase
MLDLRLVMENPDVVRTALARRSAADAQLIEPIAALAERRREIVRVVEQKAAERNSASKAMAKLDKKSPEFTAERTRLQELSTEVKTLEEQRAAIEADIQRQLEQVPNLPHETTPTGTSDMDNVVIHEHGEQRSLDFEPKAHDDIGTALGIVDFERAAKLSGSRFVVLRGAAAKLERALIGFMLDLHTREHGYVEVLPPFLVRDAALYGTGQLPKFEPDLFKTRKGDPDKSYDLYLSPTSEVQLTNLHAGEILEAEQLPIAYTAWTPCFRAEAGSHGQDVRGMIRQHQFNKVELVRICRPEDTIAEHEKLTAHAEEVLKRLGLRFRRVALCTADLGFSSMKTYDLEVWLPGQGRYREISSCSTCGDFQARRADIRYRPAKGEKPRFVHTLNGSGLAVGRTVIAILEQYQQKDGTVVVPEPLRAVVGSEVLR